MDSRSSPGSLCSLPTGRLAGLTAVWLAGHVANLGAADFTPDLDRAIQQAVALAAPAVVRIDTVGGKEQLQPGMVAAGATTGVVISAEGEILSSAFHFVSQPTSIIVTLPDGRRLAAQVVATDRLRMITLLKVDAQRLSVAKAAPKDSFRVGQWAIALGRTFEGDLPSVSVGIVSALERVWGRAVQTDAKISPVNYGGPLVDIEGRVLGILAPLSPHDHEETAGVEWYDSGIGFAVPLADLLPLVERLRDGEDLRPGLMGIIFKGKDQLQGEPVVDRLRFGSPAERAGLQSGDRIVGVEGRPVTRMAELRQALGTRYAGETVHIALKRGDQTLERDVPLVADLPPYTQPFLGLLLDRAPGSDGVALRGVWPGSPAEVGKLKAGDVLLALGTDAIKTPAELSEKLRGVPAGGELKLRVRRDDREAEVLLTVATQPEVIPAELPSHPPFGETERPAGLVVGRQSRTIAGHDRSCWIYVPESYRPDQPLALALYLHPSLQPQEQAVLASWKAECERRGILLAAPQAEGSTGWTPNDLEFLRDLIEQLSGEYEIDPARIAVIGQGNAAPLAAQLAFRETKSVRGLALIDSPPLGKVPENTPERRLHLYALVRGRNLDAARWTSFAADLRKAGYPLILTKGEGEAGTYPDAEANSELARWLDTLDTI